MLSEHVSVTQTHNCTLHCVHVRRRLRAAFGIAEGQPSGAADLQGVVFEVLLFYFLFFWFFSRLLILCFCCYSCSASFLDAPAPIECHKCFTEPFRDMGRWVSTKVASEHHIGAHRPIFTPQPNPREGERCTDPPTVFPASIFVIVFLFSPFVQIVGQTIPDVIPNVMPTDDVPILRTLTLTIREAMGARQRHPMARGMAPICV